MFRKKILTKIYIALFLLSIIPAKWKWKNKTIEEKMLWNLKWFKILIIFTVLNLAFDIITKLTLYKAYGLL